MANLKMCLCEGRHEIPDAIDGAIFRSEISDVTNVALLEEQAFSRLWGAAYQHHVAGEAGFLVAPLEGDPGDEYNLMLSNKLHIDLYVTGLTVALIAVLNVCHRAGVAVTLRHFDRATGGYYPQEAV